MKAMILAFGKPLLNHPPTPAPLPALHSRSAAAARSMLRKFPPRPKEGGD
jgi:hypothetical protein